MWIAFYFFSNDVFRLEEALSIREVYGVLVLGFFWGFCYIGDGCLYSWFELLSV